MTKGNIIKDLLVICLVYIPPLLVYSNFLRKKDRNVILLFLIGTLYIIMSIFTQNLLPFILVLLNIRFLKTTDDYETYNFRLGNLKIFRGLKYSFYSYAITICISIATLIVLNYLGIPQQKQEIVNWMAEMPLIQFLLTVPVAVIFAPVVEEFVFRWFFFEKVFKKRIGFWAGAFLSSFIFAAIHYDIQSFPMILAIGIFNCYLIDKHGYWYAVLNHSVFNSITVAALILQKLGILGM